MDVNDMHEVTFVWPNLDANEVVVTGTFDNWTSSVQLTKTPAGFQGTVKLPWGGRAIYKFVVDGRWLTVQSQPRETDNAGNLNNVYECPPKPESSTVEKLSDKSLEATPEVISEVPDHVSKDPTSSKDTISNVPILLVAALAEKGTDTNTAKPIAPGISEPSPKAAVGLTDSEPIIEDIHSLTGDPEVISDKLEISEEVKRVNVSFPPPVSSSEDDVAVSYTEEAFISAAEPTLANATTHYLHDPIDESAQQTALETIASDDTNLESRGATIHLEADLLLEDDESATVGSAQRALAAAASLSAVVTNESHKDSVIVTAIASEPVVDSTKESETFKVPESLTPPSRTDKDSEQLAHGLDVEPTTHPASTTQGDVSSQVVQKEKTVMSQSSTTAISHASGAEETSIVPESLTLPSQTNKYSEQLVATQPASTVPSAGEDGISNQVVPNGDNGASQPSTKAYSQAPPAEDISKITESFVTSSEANISFDQIAGDGIDFQLTTQPTSTSSSVAQGGVFNQAVWIEEDGQSKAQAVSEDKSLGASVENPIQEKTTNGMAPSKSQKFPSSGSTNNTVGSSQSNGVRKKRLSLFGKVKHFFLSHDKKNQN